MTKAEEFAREFAARPRAPQLFTSGLGLIAEIGPWGDCILQKRSVSCGDAIRLARWILENFTEEDA